MLQQGQDNDPSPFLEDFPRRERKRHTVYIKRIGLRVASIRSLKLAAEATVGNPATLSGEIITVCRESLGPDGSASLWFLYFKVVSHLCAVGHGGFLCVATVFIPAQIGGIREKKSA